MATDLLPGFLDSPEVGDLNRYTSHKYLRGMRSGWSVRTAVGEGNTCEFSPISVGCFTARLPGNRTCWPVVLRPPDGHQMKANHRTYPYTEPWISLVPGRHTRPARRTYASFNCSNASAQDDDEGQRDHRQHAVGQAQPPARSHLPQDAQQERFARGERDTRLRAVTSQ